MSSRSSPGRSAIERLAVRGVTVGPGARHVRLRNITDTAGLFITSADDVDVIGGSVGPGHDFSSEIKAVEGSARPPRRILIEGVTFHDWTRRDPASHVDCLHVIAVRGLVLRANRFVNCEAFDVLFTTSGDAPHAAARRGREQLLLAAAGRATTRWRSRTPPGAVYRDFLIRHNSSDNSYSVGEGSTVAGSNVRFIANVGPSFNPAPLRCPGRHVGPQRLGLGGALRAARPDRPVGLRRPRAPRLPPDGRRRRDRPRRSVSAPAARHRRRRAAA